MLKRFVNCASKGALGGISYWSQRRGVRYANMQEALKAPAGHSAGQMSILNEICCNPDAEEERRKPIFRQEVLPNSSASNSFQRGMYQWGYDSLTLFKKTNEDPGPWWNANSSTLVSNWSQVGDNANAGMWSGVWRYTYGVGEYNLRPFELRGRSWGRREPNSGAMQMTFDAPPSPLSQRLVFPHTPEHQQHRRLKQPMNKGFSEISSLHGKRILREVQYHLGQGLRFYLMDGIFGSHPETATPYRIITDNPTHAYFISLAAIRKFNYVAQQEIMLVKRVGQSPIDEWAWRRPGVLIYHTPCFDFEAPRIVEEFGGPRPSDMSLNSNHFVAVEPYSIPMKAVLSGEPSCDALLDVTASLCARWGFYADDQGFVTVPGESLLSRDGQTLTLVIANEETEKVLIDRIRASPQLYGSRHHRIAQGAVSRAWDCTSHSQSLLEQSGEPNRKTDLIEIHNQRVQRALPLRMGVPSAVSHRQFGRRHVSEFGYKWPHRYTNDPATSAYAGGHLFQKPNSCKDEHVLSALPRPSAVDLANTNILVVGEGNNAVETVLQILRENSFLYAEESSLSQALGEVLQAARSVRVVSSSEVSSTVDDLLKTKE